MSYYYTLATLLVVLIPATLIGWRLACLLPWRLRPESRLFLAPLLGLATLLHPIILLGWIGRGYRQPICLLLLAVLLVGALWGRRDFTTAVRNILLVSCFAIVTTLGVLYPVWRFAVISPYNDAFTYWVHAQWLQTHGFAQPVIPSGNYPALTQVFCYQWVGMRMGASFLFGYIQGLMGADWSFRVYPAVIALPVAACGLAVAGVAYAVCRRISLSLLCGAMTGLTLNGVSYGASHGFLPQTWGLAYVCGSLLLAGRLPKYSIRSPLTSLLKSWVPVAILSSAAIHCYSEIAPFLVGAMGFFFLYTAVVWRPYFRRIILLAAWLGVLCIALVNFECFRIARAVRTQASALVGMAVDWPWWHFGSVALGLRAGVQDFDLYLMPGPAMEIACVAAVGLIVIGLWWHGRHRRLSDLTPHAAFLLLATAAFIYFRWMTRSPWPTGTGQSWNQFKLSNWTSPTSLCLLAAGIGTLARKSSIRAWVLGVGLFGILATGAARQIQLAESRTRPIRQDTGLAFDPLAAFFRIRQLAAPIPKDNPIYLNTGEGRVGARQMLMYALMDRAVAGNWNDDAWVKPWLSPSQREQPMESCPWLVSTDPWVPTNVQRVANLWLGHCPSTSFILQTATGGYPRETDQTGWWHWTAQQLHFTYRIQGAQPQAVVVSFTSMTIGDRRPVSLTVGGRTQEVFLDPGIHAWQSETINVDHTNHTLEIVFDCQLPPAKLSDQDPRLASYLIKNLAARPENPKSQPYPFTMSGWYPVEHTGADWLCWTQARGRLGIVVSNDTVATLSGQILSAQRPNNVDIVVNGTKLTTVRVDWQNWEFRDIHPPALPLKSGDNIVEFVSHNPPVKIPPDDRLLAIVVKNLQVTIPAN